MDKGAESYRRFLDGDDDALGEIVDLYREGLILFIYKYVANLADAEDLAEDVFVELIVNPQRYGFRSSLKTYIFTLGRNKAVDFVRKQSRIRPTQEPEEKTGKITLPTCVWRLLVVRLPIFAKKLFLSSVFHEVLEKVQHQFSICRRRLMLDHSKFHIILRMELDAYHVGFARVFNPFNDFHAIIGCTCCLFQTSTFKVEECLMVPAGNVLDSISLDNLIEVRILVHYLNIVSGICAVLLFSLS